VTAFVTFPSYFAAKLLTQPTGPVYTLPVAPMAGSCQVPTNIMG
jgi:hypothetical protein